MCALVTGVQTCALPISSAKPSALITQHRPVSELGLPGYNIANWWGVFTPKSTPKEIVDALFKASNEVLRDPGVKQSFATVSEEVAPSESVLEFTRFSRQDGEQGLRMAKLTHQPANCGVVQFRLVYFPPQIGPPQ